MEQIELKVTKIKARWHVRLIVDGNVNSEMACARQEDIGYCCRQLSRWYDKCGGTSVTAATRARMCKPTNITGPVGRIWHSGYFLTKKTTK